MYRYSFLLIYRNFKRYKSSFFINLIGLSSGLACVLLIYLWVNDELNIDKFHDKDRQLFQVMQNIPIPGGIRTVEHTPGLLAKVLAEEMPEIKYATAVIPPSWFGSNQGIISVETSRLKAKGQFVDEDYFNIFSWNIIQGDKNEVLTDKYAVLISDELAMKLFHSTENVIGKAVEWDYNEFSGLYHVSGVFEKTPYNSTEQFDILFNYELFYEKYVSNLEDWGNSSPSTYVILKKGTNVKSFNHKIKDLRKSKYKELVDAERLKNIGTLFLQRYSTRYLYNHYENGRQVGGRIAYVKLFSVIAIFLLAIAGINFMNLSTAKASKRMKEIGIKKAMGSNQKGIIFQFLGESILMAFVSLTMALLLVALLLPEFNRVTGKHLSLSLSSDLVVSFLVITLVAGLFSGSYPAFYLSNLRPALVLKGRCNPSTGTAWIRKGLVIFQFTISIILIVSVIVVYKQIEFIQAKNLGLNKNNIITFKNEGQLNENLETFIQKVKNIPEVINASSSWHDLTGNHGGIAGLTWDGKNPEQRIEFGNIEVGYDWIETLGIEIVEGRVFSREFGSNNSNSSKIIFNEAAIEVMGLEDPIGKTVKFWGMEKQIIGVVKNFHFESLHKQVRPCFMRFIPNGQNILVKIKTGMEKHAIEKIQNIYQEYNQELPFDYRFLDEDYHVLYASEKRVAILSQYFAGIAILISCLGLFGLAAFTTERRLKEIGIRKVFGSSAMKIIYLLSGDFTKMVFKSILIALPISYTIAKFWLDGFAYRIDLQIWFFISAALIVLFITWFTVGMQTLKAAETNPLQFLRDE